MKRTLLGAATACAMSVSAFLLAHSAPALADAATAVLAVKAHHVVPRHEHLARRTRDLALHVEALCGTPDQLHLDAARHAAADAWLAWIGTRPLSGSAAATVARPDPVDFDALGTLLHGDEVAAWGKSDHCDTALGSTQELQSVTSDLFVASVEFLPADDEAWLAGFRSDLAAEFTHTLAAIEKISGEIAGEPDSETVAWRSDLGVSALRPAIVAAWELTDAQAGRPGLSSLLDPETQLRLRNATAPAGSSTLVNDIDRVLALAAKLGSERTRLALLASVAVKITLIRDALATE